MNDNNNVKFILNFSRRFLLFLLATVFCYLVVSLINGFIFLKFGVASPRVVAIAAVLQDVLMFITPALLTTVLITRYPAQFLNLRGTSLKVILLAFLPYVVFAPAFEFITVWNESIHFPECLAGLETSLRAAEVSAQETLKVLLDAPGVMGMVVCVLVIGVMAGFSEELFFRGAFQRLLQTARMNKHLAIWVVAFVFSAMHFQFFGLVPRLLLGAYFGYLMYWTRSIWVPMILHMTNNISYVVIYRLSGGSHEELTLDSYSSTTTLAIVVVSVVLTAFSLAYLRRAALKQE